jgi:hypothetical protein
MVVGIRPIDVLPYVLPREGRAAGPTEQWSLPAKFVNGHLRAISKSCVLMAVGDRRVARDLGLRIGDRLIVDTSERNIGAALYTPSPTVRFSS